MRFGPSLSAALICAFSFATVSQALERGLAWGVDNRLAPQLAKALVNWYWHWQDGPVPEMDHINFVPCFWGPTKWGQWNDRKNEMYQNQPSHLLAFNEPEISGQSNLDPRYAAQLFMQELQPWADRGVQVSSPQMVWKMSWLEEFMEECDRLGCKIAFMAIHWYGSPYEMDKFKQWVSSVHQRFNRPVWVTEYGITASSGASQWQIKQFNMDVTSWMASTGYVDRAAWLGSFKVSSPPDDYASRRNAFFNGNDSLRDMAYWYIYTQQPNRRSIASGPQRHGHSHTRSHTHARRGYVHYDEEGHMIVDDDVEDEVASEDAVHCDEICHARQAEIHAWASKNNITEFN